jgi:hypothetical protein
LRARGTLAVAPLLPTIVVGATPGSITDATAATLAAKCAAAKSKAAVKEITAKLKCDQKAKLAGKTVDPTCLMTAETKFVTAVGKAETAGGCVVIGDVTTIDSVANNCVNPDRQPNPGDHLDNDHYPAQRVVRTPDGSLHRRLAVLHRRVRRYLRIMCLQHIGTLHRRRRLLRAPHLRVLL